MKKIYLPLALAATLALGACSSDNVVDNGGSTPIDLSKGGFVKMSLNLPTDNNRGSRATLDDGLANEYGIKNAYLVLFEGGDDENAATIKGAYALNSSNFEAVGDDPNHVTITKRIAFANDTKKPSDSNKHIYALVVLNNNGMFTVDGTTHTLTFATNITPGDYATTANFANFSKAIASTNTDGTTPFASNVAINGIFMTNAPLCTQPGGTTAPGTDAAIKTLADVTSNIYTTEAEAKSKPAAEIYVERAVAKVTVQNKTGELVANQNNAASKISYKLYNWAVDNTNKKSYIVRQYDKSWNSINSNKVTAADASKFRFVWSTPVNPNATDANKLYRTAFAQDPEYKTTTADADNYNRIASNASMSTAFGNSTEFGNEHPQYCNENTFQVTAQNQDQTTRVVLGVKMSAPGTTTYDADLYTVNDNKEVVYTKATLAERLKKILLNDPAVNTWAENHKTDASFDITFDPAKADAGATAIKEATFKGKTAAGATEETLKSFTTEQLNKALPNIVRYKGGVAYYAVRIKHFGDTEGTPWNVAEQGVTAGGNSKIYPGANEGWFLGRYGVVRNNWYDISVNKIQTLGDATTPALSNTPDDVLENYISVSINVLSRSKHTQGADL